MDISAIWNLPLPRLFLESSKLGCPHILCPLHEPRSYVFSSPTKAAHTNETAEWQWDQLRIMKVGGNDSATKFFQSNGGTAALNSKDATTKYTSNAATKYKEELKRRSAKDAIEYGYCDDLDGLLLTLVKIPRRSSNYGCYEQWAH